MGIKVGTPVLKLDGQKKYRGKNSRSGNAGAIIREMFPDEDGIRHSADTDYNSELTKKNIGIEGFQTAKEAEEFIYSQAEKYKVIDKNGNEKKLRSDANIAFSQIIKPDMESMEGLSTNEQVAFLLDYYEENKKVLNSKGLKIVGSVIHMDEMNPHIHILGYDPEYKMGKKVDIKLFSKLNKDIPKAMQSKGYDVEVLERYDVDYAKTLDDDELSEYKAKVIKEKKESKKQRLSSTEYKAQKEAQNILDEAETQGESILSDYSRVFNARKKFLDEKESQQEQTSQELNTLKEELDTRERSLNVRRAKIIEEEENISNKKAEALKMHSEASERLKNAKSLEPLDTNFVDYLKRKLSTSPKGVEFISKAAEEYANLQKRTRVLMNESSDLEKGLKTISTKGLER